MSHGEIAGYVERLPAAPSPERSLFRTAPGEVSGQFYGCRLASVFQPIAGRDGALVGHQGLVRCHGEGALELSPWRLFADAADEVKLVQLDRLARTVHALNYFGAADDGLRLALTVEQRLLEAVQSDHGRHYARILEAFGVAPRRVIITLPESANANPGLLADVAANYRRAGYRVAVRADGVGAETVRGFAHLRPDLVRVRTAPADDAAWRKMFEVVHAMGAAAHVTHIEASSERNRLAALGADWLQGHAVGRPGPLPVRREVARTRVVHPTPRSNEPFRTPRHATMQPGELELPLWIPPSW